MDIVVIGSVAVAVVLLLLGYRSRAGSILAAVVAIAFILGYAPLQGLLAQWDARSETSVVQSLDTQMAVSADGTMRVIEAIEVRFTESRRGIFRYFSPWQLTDPEGEWFAQVAKIERCEGETCRGEPWVEYLESGRQVVRIGDASVSYPADTVQTYLIEYTIANTLIESVPGESVGADTGALWAWQVVADGWLMPIETSTVRVTLPGEPVGQVDCRRAGADCPVEVSGRTVTGTTGHLAPFTPVTWKVALDPTGLDLARAESSVWLSPIARIGAVLAGLLLFLLTWVLIRRGKERPVDDSPRFVEPGPDLLSLAWTRTEFTPEDSLQALLLLMNREGMVRVTTDPSDLDGSLPDWIELESVDPDRARLLTGGATVIDTLGLSRPGSRLRIERDSETAGRSMQKAQQALPGEVRTAVRARGLARTSPSGAVVHVMASTWAPLAVVVMGVGGSVWPALTFAIAGLAGIGSERSLKTELTPAGLVTRDHVAGLRTALSTKASMDRYDYALRVRYFERFLPWAVALDCAESWAEACRPPESVDPGTGHWYPHYVAFRTSQAVSTSVASVATAAIAAHARAQASSSSGGFGGGGGFSGGGGGGGGSW